VIPAVFTAASVCRVTMRFHGILLEVFQKTLKGVFFFGFSQILEKEGKSNSEKVL
jgi:hypothetical protein